MHRNEPSPLLLLLVALFLGFTFLTARAAGESPGGDFAAAIADLQTRWTVANYELQGKARKSAFAKLAEDAETVTRTFPQRADAWIWSGIITSTYAGVKGGIGALKLAKAARADLEKALAIDPQAMRGSAYTSLGTLYHKVPGWPLGFGDDKKAGELLRKALVLNPDGIDPNYFYGEYLLEKGDKEQARQYLLRARQAPPRPNRPLADQGRQRADVPRSAAKEHFSLYFKGIIPATASAGI